MARAKLTPVELALGSHIAAGAGTAIVAADGAELEAQEHPVLLVITNGAAVARTVTVKAGVRPPALLAADAALSYAAGEVRHYCVPVSGGARHAQVGGSTYIDVSGADVTIAAYALPAGLV